MKITLSLQYILYALELAACVTGFWHWRKVKRTPAGMLPVYLAFIVVAEQTGNYLNYTAAYDLKRNLFNYIFIPAEYMFFYWVYYKAAAGIKEKRIVVLCMAIYAAAFIADQLYFSNRKYFFVSFSYCIGNFCLVMAVISFFIQFARGREIIYFRSSLLFWMSLGLLIFYLGTLPYFGLLSFLYNKYREIFFGYTYIMFVLNWMMYLLFIAGFVWTKKN